MAGVHDGHRKRVREQFLQEGCSEHMPAHKMLEMLLFYTVPRKDTNEIAHRLIDAFGSYAGVLDAHVDELKKVPGVSEKTACLFKLVMPAARMYLDNRSESKGTLAGKEAASDYLAQKFYGRTVETAFLLCMDNRGRVLSCPKLSEGDEISVAVSARQVVEEALKSRATAVIIGHNHPAGFALPSEGDVRVTGEIAQALFHLHVKFVDHIIVANDDYISMRDTREYKGIFR